MMENTISDTKTQQRIMATVDALTAAVHLYLDAYEKIGQAQINVRLVERDLDLPSLPQPLCADALKAPES